jgi:hypothetical protein
LQQLTKLAAATSLSISLIAQPCMADELSFAFPASGNPEIREAQKALVESWGELGTAIHIRSGGSSYLQQPGTQLGMTCTVSMCLEQLFCT